MSGEELRISRAQRAFGAGLSLLLVGLALRAAAGPYEDWPFTSAPMFARYHAPGEPVYYLEWWVVSAVGRRLLEPKRDLGIGELPFRRGYFTRFYGSADQSHPGGRHDGDGQRAFVERQSDFCRRLTSAWRRRSGGADARFDLEVSERVAGKETARRPIGSCGHAGFRRPK